MNISFCMVRIMSEGATGPDVKYQALLDETRGS